MNDYFLLFLTDGLCGYYLQAIGYLLGIYVFTRRKIRPLEFFLMSLAYVAVIFGIRQISVISFGFHTILIMVLLVVLAILLLKTPIFMTVVGTLASSISILIAELITMAILSLNIGYDQTMAILSGGEGITGRINKAIAGIPINVLLIVLMLIYHAIIRKIKPKEVPANGSAGAPSGKNDGSISAQQ